MPRPRRFRMIGAMPNATYFKPVGVPMANLDVSVLTVDEFEAIRLKDHDGLDQKEAAEKMNISQSTFQRIYGSARKNIADAIVNGKSIKIEGGNYKMAPIGLGLGRGLRRGINAGGRGRMSGFAAGPGGTCVCPKCGHKETQIRGLPCMNKTCPKCGTKLTRT